MNSQIELYYSRNGSWPADLGDVTNDPNYFPDGPPECPFEIPYVYITTNDKNRVNEHMHIDSKEVKTISDRVFDRN